MDTKTDHQSPQTAPAACSAAMCAVCGKPATCFGSYDGPYNYACDSCCGHGNEDGVCWPITGRYQKCPHCGDSVIQSRDGSDYCEECGWPDDSRELDPMLCHHCKSILLWSEDRGPHCDGCEDFDPETDLSNAKLSTGSK